jgi:hypothetical protein
MASASASACETPKPQSSRLESSDDDDDDEYIAPSDESDEDGLDVAAFGRNGCCVIGCKSDCKCKCRDSNCIRMLCNEHATETKRLCHTCRAKRAAIRNNRN